MSITLETENTTTEATEKNVGPSVKGFYNQAAKAIAAEETTLANVASQIIADSGSAVEAIATVGNVTKMQRADLAREQARLDFILALGKEVLRQATA